MCVLLLLPDCSAEIFFFVKQNFFDISYARMRAIVEPAIVKQSLVLHSDYLKKAKVMKSSVESTAATEVEPVIQA
ncbi:hypothetical protein R1flu_005039 [Riccia fluitans]|uniref:Uncharacterized protein n=1 Tax=Riccia fluitans TaxID=41844 RepID=A0ABD1YS07_9MARC